MHRFYFINFSVRFVSGSSPDTYYGHIEFLDRTGKSYSVCSANWGDNDAVVACREMGFQTGRSFNNLVIRESKKRGEFQTILIAADEKCIQLFYCEESNFSWPFVRLYDTFIL